MPFASRAAKMSVVLSRRALIGHEPTSTDMRPRALQRLL
ncbi:hypothetical protein SAMN05446935_1461 [Burkholderia sp. YR290]|nr:hypothetical protein SAMN05446935_1461 [Burkholderia sp. YR290]